MFNRNMRLLTALAAALTLAACGDHQPGDATGAKVLAQYP